jgi:hypothetical protein
MPKDTTNRLREDSDLLLAQLQDVTELEAEKRHYRIGTPRFRELAARIERKSREIFVRAADERVTGELVPAPKAISIEDVEPSN